MLGSRSATGRRSHTCSARRWPSSSKVRHVESDTTAQHNTKLPVASEMPHFLHLASLLHSLLQIQVTTRGVMCSSKLFALTKR